MAVDVSEQTWDQSMDRVSQDCSLFHVFDLLNTLLFYQSKWRFFGLCPQLTHWIHYRQRSLQVIILFFCLSHLSLGRIYLHISGRTHPNVGLRLDLRSFSGERCWPCDVFGWNRLRGSGLSDCPCRFVGLSVWLIVMGCGGFCLVLNSAILRALGHSCLNCNVFAWRLSIR